MKSHILEIENLTVSFDGFKALNQLNFAMETGELRVIIGPNGAGKTTFLDVITGKVQPTIGQVRFKGRNLRSISEHEIARLGIGRKFQTPRVYLNLTPRENLELSGNRNKNVFATLFQRPPKAERLTVSGLLETIGLTAKADMPAALLSHGEKQWLEIGMLVAQSPDLLLVDEPVAGLTDEETERTGELLLSLAESHSIIVIEHDMEFVRQIARKVTVLHEGTVLCEGTIEQVQNDPRVIEVYLGQEPSITPHQMKLLRVVAAMAWVDGNLAPAEVEVILSRLSQLFAESAAEQQKLREELRAYVVQEVPIDETVQEITSPEERELILKLAYDVIQASTAPGETELISPVEAAAYQKLAEFLGLPADAIDRVTSAPADQTGASSSP
ncbi:urea ABC transporter ATP-binding protein UrtD [Trichothermofontia sichuanensis B231]|uniref:urea ABC transporter ATP-binding protein UrtD n=1 Tax=Trichothermofontia sichuanensis TaxID=3045816 RepID=UPI0022479DB1|nr:urea ABC transporter ATP-binding protein UrtD [Trichothermofontia sichuanensis]UZQ54067.1 urea ABC transporter ATP-binding protein UrtD [Trichothermofontia sichuanensis B231]